MLSILQKQSKLLEKELLETRQELERLKRVQKEHDAILAERDERIKSLEDEAPAAPARGRVDSTRAQGGSPAAAEWARVSGTQSPRRTSTVP